MGKQNSKQQIRDRDRDETSSTSISSTVVSTSKSEPSTSTAKNGVGHNSIDNYYQDELKDGANTTIDDLNPIGILELSDEIMLEIFSYLDFGDRREARRVCQRWKSVISIWSDFTDNVCCQLRRSPSSNSWSTLNSSDVPWRNIRLNKCIGRKPPIFYFPKYIQNTLTGLTLFEGTFRWSWFICATGRFNFLENLGIINCRIFKCRKLDEDTKEQFNDFLALRRRLKDLTIALQCQESHNLSFYLSQFTDSASVLRELKITCDFAVDSRVDQLATTLVSLVTCSRASLKSLKLKGNLHFVNALCLALPNLKTKRKANQLNLDRFHLQLSNPEVVNSLSPNEATMNNFVLSQPNLKSLVLSITGTQQRLQNFYVACPKHLEEFQTNQKSILGRKLFELFGELKRMRIEFGVGSRPCSFVKAIGNKVYPDLRELSISRRPCKIFMRPITVAFPNLVKLIVSCVDHPSCLARAVNDVNLQIIIRNLQHLKVLRLKSFNCISDVGVSGIRVVDAEILLESKSLYLEPDLSELGIFKVGLPLSSLKFLNEVSLTYLTPSSINSRISDVGIFYGFGFKDLRKLYLSCGSQVSDWGLVKLGILNPSLECCYIKTDSTMITDGAKLLLQQTVPRSKQHHLVQGLKPDESDPHKQYYDFVQLCNH